jgi:hypothetical protein
VNVKILRAFLRSKKALRAFERGKDWYCIGEAFRLAVVASRRERGSSLTETEEPRLKCNPSKGVESFSQTPDAAEKTSNTRGLRSFQSRVAGEGL